MNLMDAVTGRDYLGVLDAGEMMVALDSKEKQKAFCKFAGDCVRKIFMVQKNMQEISGIRPSDRQFFKETAGKCGPMFCNRALSALNRANSLLVRNVNQKIIFTNLVNRLFVS